MTERSEAGSLAGAQQLKRWLRPLMLVVAGGFVLLTGLDLAARWRAEDSGSLQLHLGLAALSLLPILVGNLLQGLAWILLVQRMAQKSVPRWPALALYLESQLARYTPGKIGLPLVRMEGAPRLGLSRKLVASSVLIEMLSWTATGAVVGFLLLAVVGSPDAGLGAWTGPWEMPLLLASLGGGVLLVALDRRRIPGKVIERLALDGHGPLAPRELPLVQGVYWLTWAAHAYLLALAFGASSLGALSVIAFWPLANVLGFVALAAPAGVGVREAVLIFGLAPVLGGPGALGAALLSRVHSLFGDIVVWLFARGVSRRVAD